ncbi:MAG: efflux transporter outer membrane subunit [Betaproteobacteria bacterium]|nr:MAG: efflux transporter outer membrane subunit [Betaproteobacteria bacterium]TMH84102.1 MAG: efflux transporter outer membrane subunit [Betaproteobacteria bacterium]
MVSARKLSFACALLLAGCAVGPDYERPAMELPAAYPEQDIGAAALRPDWWKLYNDPKLDELVASTLERNADIRLAVARIEEADANLRAARAAFLPEIDLTGAANRQGVSTRTAVPIPGGIPSTRNNVRLALSTSFELDFWGHLRRGVESVRAQMLSTRYARDVVALTLAGLTTQAYFGLRSLDAQIIVTRETLANREDSLAYVRARARGGIASDLDIAQAEGARADIAAQLKDLERQRALIEHQLATLTGRLDQKLADGDLRTLPVPALPPADLPSTLLERRPDVQQAEQQLVSANAQIGVAKAAMFPTISLTSFYGGESTALWTLLNNGASIWSIGFGLSLPVFDGGRYTALTDAAIARDHQTLAGYQKVVETAFREVADALVSVRQTSSAEADYQASVDAARRALRLSRMRYEAGYSPYLEVLEAQRAANVSELAALRNRQSLLSASVDLMKALGGGWSAEQLSLK